MKFTGYIKDKALSVFIALFATLILIAFMSAYKVNKALTISAALILFITFSSLAVIDYCRRRKFYRALINLKDKMDKPYLLPNVLKTPHFYEGVITRECFSVMSKSMRDRVRAREDEARGYKDYIEMWVHEVKVPLAALSLAAGDNPRIKNNTDRIGNYLEQALYYARSETGEKDYMIAPVNLSVAVKNAALRNMSLITRKGIDFTAQNLDFEVMSDSKWLEFMIGQLLQNSRKYSRLGEDRRIKVSAERAEEGIILSVWDNGMGIPRRDLPRVFDKSFTGYNGRQTQSSTGMGLFIVKKLRGKLGIKILIDSKQNLYTRLRLVFPDDSYYREVRDIS